MAKRHPFKKVKPGEPIPVTARQLESFVLEHNGKFNSRNHNKFSCTTKAIKNNLPKEKGDSLEPP